jgi:hypothetical protein
MDAKPVQQKSMPGYPTRREVLAGAATFVLAQCAGNWRVWAATEAGATIVAPIFKHGEGRGAVGCVVVSPPVFLSEEEAMQIIGEELAKSGIRLKGGEALEGVRIPQRFRKYDFGEHAKKDSEGGRKLPRLTLVDGRLTVPAPPLVETPQEKVVEARKHAKPLKLDGIDSEKRVAVEFVCYERYYDLGGVQESYDLSELDDSDAKADSSSHGKAFSTAQSYDFKGAAEYVAAQVKTQGKAPIYLGLFYDPQWEEPAAEDKAKDETEQLEATLERRKKSLEQSKAEGRKLLRQQAQDFVAWLKEKKAIP